MDQHFFGSTPDPSAQAGGGYQTLMNSLLSPAATVHPPGFSGDLWPNLPAWQNLPPGPMGFGFVPQGPQLGMTLQDGEQDSSDIEMGGAAVPDATTVQESISTLPGFENPQTLRNHQAGSSQDYAMDRAADTGDHMMQTSGATQEKGNPSSSVPDSKKRAAELRAKLLAKRATSVAPPGSPQISNKNLNSHKANTTDASTANGAVGASPVTKGKRTGSVKSGMSADIENLFAEARNVADTPTKRPTSNTSNPALLNSQDRSTRPGNTAPIGTPVRVIIEPSVSSDEEGEIRDESTRPTSVDRADEPVKSIESGQLTTTDSQEKMIRQTETHLVYQTLNKGGSDKNGRSKNPSKIKVITKPPPKALADHQVRAETQKSTVNNRPPKPAQEQAVATKEHQKEPVDSTSRHADENKRRGSNTEASVQDAARSERHNMAVSRRAAIGAQRQAEIEASARAADQYKKDLNERRKSQGNDRQEARGTTDAGPKQDPTKNMTAKSPTDVPRGASVNSAQQTTAPRPTTSQDKDRDPNTNLARGHFEINEEDLRDWLDLTDFFDAEYRMRKLARLRKKRELERLKAELEREDLLEQEERAKSARASSAMSPPDPSVSPQSLLRASLMLSHMQPPPAPLRPAANEAAVSNAKPTPAATTVQPVVSSPLGTPSNEMDVDAPATRPAAKFGTLETVRNGSGQVSPAIKGETHSAPFSPAFPFEGRYRPPSPENNYRARSRSPYRQSSRYDGQMRDRQQLRHSSYSPRRFSNSQQPFDRQQSRFCSHCGASNHHVNVCPKLKLGTADIDTRRGSGLGISPNYRGKNPKPMPWAAQWAGRKYEWGPEK